MTDNRERVRRQSAILNSRNAPSQQHARRLQSLNRFGLYAVGGVLLAQTGFWHSGGKIAWVPNYDGSVKEVIWATNDQNAPFPDWLINAPFLWLSTQVLTTASTSPWTVDGTWNATTNNVELVGSGGDALVASDGTRTVGNPGAGAGAYTKLANGALSGTVAFFVDPGNGGAATLFENTTNSNCYFANSGQSGGIGPSSAGGAGGTAGTTTGSPAVTFTVSTNNVGGTGGAVGGGVVNGGAGGGGAGGPVAAGGTGGSNTNANGGGGGAGANNGAAGNGVNSTSGNNGKNGGQGSSGTPGTGGADPGGGASANPGGNGTGNSGGGGGSVNNNNSGSCIGGNGGSGADFDATHGLGGGGGGSGRNGQGTGVPMRGGNGGLYGGGAGGVGQSNGTGNTWTNGKGGAGVIFLSWTPASGAPTGRNRNFHFIQQPKEEGLTRTSLPNRVPYSAYTSPPPLPWRLSHRSGGEVQNEYGYLDWYRIRQSHVVPFDTYTPLTPEQPAKLASRPRPEEESDELTNWRYRLWSKFALPIEPATVQSIVYHSRQKPPEQFDEYYSGLVNIQTRRRRVGFVFSVPPVNSEYVTKELGFAVVTPPAEEIVAKVIGLVVDSPNGEAVFKSLGLTSVSPAGESVAKVIGMVVVTGSEPFGDQPIPVFPTLPQGFPVKWRPTLKTITNETKSGRQVRFPNQNFALHEFELVFEVLRDQTQNQTVYQPLAGFTDFMQLCQFWLSMYGKFGLFYFDAPWDDSRKNQFIGTGDGNTATFLAVRTFGTANAGLTEPVGAINQLIAVYFDNIAQPTNTYSFVGNQIIFSPPPPANAVITADFTFYYVCHFTQDNQDFDEFFKNIWQVKVLPFRSTIGVLGGVTITPPNPPTPPPTPPPPLCVSDFLWRSDYITSIGATPSHGSATNAVDDLGNGYVNTNQGTIVFDSNGNHLQTLTISWLADQIDAWSIHEVGGGPVVDRSTGFNGNNGFRIDPVFDGSYLVAFFPAGNNTEQRWFCVLTPSTSGLPNLAGAVYYQGFLVAPFVGSVRFLGPSNSKLISDPLLYMGSRGFGGFDWVILSVPSVVDIINAVASYGTNPIWSFVPDIFDIGTNVYISTHGSMQNLMPGWALPNGSGGTNVYFYLNRGYMDFSNTPSGNNWPFVSSNVSPAYPLGAIMKLNLGIIDKPPAGTGTNELSPGDFIVDNINWVNSSNVVQIPFTDEYSALSNGATNTTTDCYAPQLGGLLPLANGNYWAIFYMPGLDDAVNNTHGTLYESIRIFEYNPRLEHAVQIYHQTCIVYALTDMPNPAAGVGDYLQTITLSLNADTNRASLTIEGPRADINNAPVYKAIYGTFTPP